MTSERIVLVFEPEGAPPAAELLDRARRRGFSRFVGVPTAVLPSESWFRDDGGTLRPNAGTEGTEVEVRWVTDPASLEVARARLAAGATVLVRWKGERVIPLETLVAGAPARGRLWARAERPAEAPGLLGALEHGAGTVVVAIRNAPDLEELETFLESASHQALDWQIVAVDRVVPSGPGDRVIVDTTSLLSPEEGFLVGSVAGFLFHVRSEAVGSRYTRPRPFRVNAGGPHSYVLLADGTSRYLSELTAGDRLLAVRPPDQSRAVRVGRLKIERRPLTRIEAEDEGRRVTLFVQEAETVRLSGEDGPIEVTQLRAGDHLRGVRCPPARHLGAVVDEQIEER